MFQTLVKIGFYDGVVFGIICCCFGDFFKFGACWKWKKRQQERDDYSMPHSIGNKE